MSSFASVEAPPRPPRPQHIDPEVLKEVCHRFSTRARDVITVVDTPAGRIVEDKSGQQIIDVPPDRPDANGQHGLMVYRAVSDVPGALSLYADPEAGQQRGRDEEWSLADLDLEAGRLFVPAAEGGPGGPSHRGWIAGDPRRARAVWLRRAADMGIEPAQALHRSPECVYCRKVILASGWLSPGEAVEL